MKTIFKNKKAINHKYLNSYYYERVEYPISDEIRKLPEKLCVYLIGNPVTKLCKIGITDNIYSRIQNLRSQSGCNLSVLISIELELGYDEPAVLIEQVLHEFFHQKRVGGEWFNLNFKDIIQIRNVFYGIGGDWIEDNVNFVLQHNGFIKNYKYYEDEKLRYSKDKLVSL